MMLCLLLSDFAATLERQWHPELAAAPLVIVIPKGNRQIVYAASDDAKRAGITVGMGKSRVLALCPDAIIYQGIPKRYQALAEKICQSLLIVTDQIEYEQSSSLAIWLDIGAVSREDTQTLLTCAQATLAQHTEGTLYIGIAPGRSTARIAAATAHQQKPRWLMPGEEKSFLASLPLRAFALPPKLLEQFDGIGLERLADLARLPYNSVRTRFGEQGSQLHRLAHGYDRLRLDSYDHQEPIVQSFRLDIPVGEVGMVEGVISQFAQLGTHQLRERNLTSGEVILILEFDDKTRLEATRTLREPMDSQPAIREELMRLLIQATLPSGIGSLTMILNQLKPPQPRQMDFFGQLFHEAENEVVTLVETLAPRHDEVVFSRVTVASQPSYLLERNVSFEQVAFA